MSDVAIRIEGLSKSYRIGGKREQYRTLRDSLASAATMPARAVRSRLQRSNGQGRNSHSTIWALKDVSLEIGRGEVVGIIGRNGAGKSTLLKILSRITEPTEGRAEIHGRIASLLEVGTGFHLELTGRENIYLNGAILGMPMKEINRKFDEIVAFAEVGKFIDTPVKHYSSGMYLRLAFAVAAHLEPEILLVDEVLAVGDAAFQKKCLGKMGEVAQEGRTVLFVSHNMGAIRALCNRGIVLSDGQVTQSGAVTKAIETYYKMITEVEVAQETGSNGHTDKKRSWFGPVTLPDEDGTTVSQSEEFKVETTLHIPDNVQGFSIWCMLDDMHGRHIFALREESTLFGIANMTGGAYDISVIVPSLWLVPGLYSLYFKAKFWGDDAASRVVSDMFPLDVAGESSRAESVLHPGVLWSVQRTEGELVANESS